MIAPTIIGKATLYNMDCLDFLAEQPDKSYELAICDPMYDLPDNYLVPGTEKSITCVKRNFVAQAKKLATQEVVGEMYFKELQRVSKNQIVWGENYFQYDEKPVGRIIWDKLNDSSTFSNAEIASCSIIKGVRIIRYLWNGMIQADMKNKEVRIHPFQKPVAVYEQILTGYAKPGDRILDTHLGSMSSVIAANNLGYELTGCELDADYFKAGCERAMQATAQERMFP